MGLAGRRSYRKAGPGTGKLAQAGIGAIAQAC